MHCDVLSANLRRRKGIEGEGEAMAASPERVRVKRELLAACMTCPICAELLTEATTVSECLHTFCRKCILEKLNEEELDCCPVCYTHLGVVPMEKLRPDHNLQELRAKIFPIKRRKVNAPEVEPSITLPVRRKERSLSSLVVSTPRVTTQSGLTGRRTKARRATALRGLGPIIQEQKEVNDYEGFVENPGHSRRQNSFSLEPSNHLKNRDVEEEKESFKGKTECWDPLNHLVEAAIRTKPPKSAPESFPIREELVIDVDSEEYIHKRKLREQPHKSKTQDENKGCATTVGQVKGRGRRALSHKKRDLETSSQALIDAAGATNGRRTSAIWLSLVPSVNQKGDAKLPQTSACYLRIKDGSLPVSFIQKYLVKKLNLASETEVEIACRGQTLNPKVSLRNLEDLWLNSSPSERVKATVGASAKDFVMVLNYTQKAPAQ